MSDFKPSQLVLHPVPFVGTMKKAECEITAAYVVRALVVLGDEWKAVGLAEVRDIAKADLEAKAEPMRFWANPFVQPAPWLLRERGFATIDNDAPGGPTIAFTEQGIAALQRYARAEPANV